MYVYIHLYAHAVIILALEKSDVCYKQTHNLQSGRALFNKPVMPFLCKLLRVLQTLRALRTGSSKTVNIQRIL